MKFAGMRSVNKILILLLFLLGCRERDSVTPDIGFFYFPIQVHDFSVYDVEETNIVSSISTKSTYQLKVTVTDSVVESNTVSYFLLREKRNNSGSDWEPFETWSVKLTDDEVIQNENNVWFVKLISPLSANLTWNGNTYNNLQDNGNLFNGTDSDKYYVSEFNKPITLSTGFSASETVVIVHNNFSDDVVGVDQRTERYSKNEGLIYKEVTQLEYCTSSGCLGQQKPTKGIIYKQTLVEHGAL